MTSILAQLSSHRPNPAEAVPDANLSDDDRQHSAGLMRVNHTGEVCAQALYRGQMVVARQPATRDMLAHACEEEIDHLAWTHDRLIELDSHRSYLNVFWYSHAFLIGLLAGLAGDRISLGFIEETEHQVGEHLTGHLGRLPAEDQKSRAIVAQMREDEARHGASAAQAGAAPLPDLVKGVMRLQAKVMTTLVYWV